MITPGSQNFTGYVGSTFDTIITVYPASAANFNWLGAWTTGTIYNATSVVIGTDSNAYLAWRTTLSGENPVGDALFPAGSWSTPIVPLNLNNWSGTITVLPVETDEILLISPYLSTPVQVQGVSGTIGIKFSPQQSTPFLPKDYHYYITMTDPSGNIYYYLNGIFTWMSP